MLKHASSRKGAAGYTRQVLQFYLLARKPSVSSRPYPSCTSALPINQLRTLLCFVATSSVAIRYVVVIGLLSAPLYALAGRSFPRLARLPPPFPPSVSFLGDFIWACSYLFSCLCFSIAPFLQSNIWLRGSLASLALQVTLLRFTRVSCTSSVQAEI